MNNIKFRIWDKEFKVMRHVSGIDFDNECTFSNYPDVDMSCERKFQGIELMQWTGFTNKDGKDIYEGDIIYVIHSWGADTWVIKRNPESNQLMMLNPYSWLEEYEDMADYDLSEYQIGGNVFKNPELLDEC